jgi:hypothetical protein
MNHKVIFLSDTCLLKPDTNNYGSCQRMNRSSHLCRTVFYDSVFPKKLLGYKKRIKLTTDSFVRINIKVGCYSRKEKSAYIL